LLAGSVRDAIVGRDVLFGAILGVVWVLVFRVAQIPLSRLGAAPALYAVEYLAGGRQALGLWLYQVPSSILGALQFFFLLLGLKVLVRKGWIAAVLFVGIFTGLNSLGSHYPLVDAATALVVYSVAVLIVFRFGLVSLACAIFTVDLLANVPFSSDLSVWYMTTSILALLSVVAMAGWGFYHSLGGAPLWRPEVE
jgi:hypothetical protein